MIDTLKLISKEFAGQFLLLIINKTIINMKELYDREELIGMVFMIATIRKGKDTIIWFRLLDTFNKGIVTVTYENILEAIKFKKMTIENLKIEGSKLKGHNGSIERYPILDTQLQLISKSPVIILAKKLDSYLCSDHTGKIAEINEKDVVDYAIKNGIANGKLVGKSISAIEGNYINLKDKNVEALEQKLRGYNAKVALLGLTRLEIKIDGLEAIIVKAPQTIITCTIPEFITIIGSDAFNGCDSLQNIDIPSNVKLLGRGAFYNCRSLKNVTVASSNTRIKSLAFSGCESLESIALGNGVIELGNDAFSFCRSLQHIVIPSSIKKIEGHTFSKCQSLRSIVIPNNVKEIGNDAFAMCRSLQSVTIQDGVEKIGNYAFGECKSLKSIALPDSIREIEDRAFYSCTSLQSIVIPNSVKQIYDETFFGCTELNGIKAPEWLMNLFN